MTLGFDKFKKGGGQTNRKFVLMKKRLSMGSKFQKIRGPQEPSTKGVNGIKNPQNGGKGRALYRGA